MMKKNSGTMRTDLELKNLIKDLKFNKMARDRKPVSERRITRAMARQYRNNPALINQIMEADLT